MTGGHVFETTEILRNKKWIVLANGNLPGGSKIFGLGLINIDNQVFAFGKTTKRSILDSSSSYNMLLNMLEQMEHHSLNLFEH